MVLCDTNIVIDYFKNRQPVLKKVELLGEDRFCISTITATELYYGARDKKELQQIKSKLDLIIRIPLNEGICNIFEELMFEFSLSHKLSIPDALIASTALFYDLQLYTLNKKDFNFINGIKLYR